ncbi:MAG: MATE family efflux transporter, partial [Chloroflexota bacterium]
MNWVSRDKALIRDVLRISLPVIGEHLVGLAVGVVNTRLVGHLGAAALAAVSLSTQWIFLTNVLFATFSMGATTLVAQSVGAGDWDTSNRTVRQVTLAGVAIGLVAAVLALLFAEPAMALMGA